MSNIVANGVALKVIREAKSQLRPEFLGSKFAIACLISHSYLCNIEAGRKQPPEAVLRRIAACLEVPVEAISYPAPAYMEATA